MKNLKKIAVILSIASTFALSQAAFAEKDIVQESSNGVLKVTETVDASEIFGDFEKEAEEVSEEPEEVKEENKEEVKEESINFVDMPEDQTKQALEAAVKNGLLNGYEENGVNEIRPLENITRAQMGAILVRAMGATKTADISEFVDMNESQWYYGEMSKAVAMGAFKGDDQKKLNPEANITFQEAFIVISRIFDLADRKANSTEDPFAKYSDADLVADWAKEDVGYILKFGYWQQADGLLRPTEYINRAEFAVLMDNLVKTYIDEPGTVTEFADGNVVIRVPDVTISGYNQMNDVYISDGVEGKIIFENSNLDRVVARGGNVDYISGTATEIRMLTPGLAAYIAKTAKVQYFDGTGCTVTFDPFEM